MDIIHLLPESVANQIAAGEVVDRPSSVVKELVENAIDANATNIRVNIKDSGRTLIQVVDNGKGMSETDARMAFERHATSKIQSVDDLYLLRTMGFRGEALASIASVAQVELKTRKSDMDLGVRLEIDGSNLIEKEQIVCNEGSVFSVKNLFFNVPGRRRFLKSNETEFRHILTTFSRIAIIYPQIAFSLYHDDKLIYDLPSTSLLSRIIDIFGKRLKNQLLPIEVQTEHVYISGYVGSPDSATKSGSNQYFFVNGRFMKHSGFHRAVLQAYDRLLMPSTTPNYFISLTLDPQSIDVNIHPQKIEVKFDNEKYVWAILNAAVRESLGKFNIVPGLDFDNPVDVQIPTIPTEGVIRKPSIGADPTFNPFKGTTSSVMKKTDWNELYAGFQKEKEVETQSQQIQFEENMVSTDNLSEISVFDLSKIDVETLSFLRMNQQYVFAVSNGYLLMIHLQRAVFKVMFERVKRMFSQQQPTKQMLLFPEILAFSAEQEVVMENLVDELIAIGFELENLDLNQWQLTAIPADLSAFSASVLISDMVSEVMIDGVLDKQRLQYEMSFSLAKRMTESFRQVNSDEELKLILGELFVSDSPNYTPDGKMIVRVSTPMDFFGE